jgi:pyruvate dehydrogenase E2 component (dihydrolipoamide acetyltransferase)
LTVKTIEIPDIGGAENVDVIEVLVKPGDKIQKESSLITLESEKASMEVPSPYAGTVKEVKVKVGDKVSQGSAIVSVDVAEEGKAEPAAIAKKEAKEEPKKVEEKPVEKKEAAPAAVTKPQAPPITKATASAEVYAGPAARRLARELGVELSAVPGSGPKNRVMKDDIKAYVKAELAKPKGTAGFVMPAAPQVDFAKFGSIEIQPLNKIKKLTGINVHRSWITVPHVTQFGEADITELEAFREQQKAAVEKRGVKLTPLVFIMKAVVAALKAMPQFNSSLDASGENLILKKYYHLGVAVDTPNGLVVPVVRDVDKKGVFELAKELAEISKKAREKGLSLNEMQGSCFTISSLGGIGGTAFTPIVNTPDVAILGVSKSSIKPIYQNGAFMPRLMLPLSLSYDHRVIDGADGARFMVHLTEWLTDIRTLLL